MEDDRCKVLVCACVNKYQDGMYGRKRRLHNFMDKDGGWRCTVCGTERTSK